MLMLLAFNKENASSLSFVPFKFFKFLGIYEHLFLDIFFCCKFFFGEKWLFSPMNNNMTMVPGVCVKYKIVKKIDIKEVYLNLVLT